MTLRAVADAAIAACRGERLCAEAVDDLEPGGVVHVAGAGKAAGQMLRGVVGRLSGAAASGLAFTKDGAFDGFVPPGVEVCFSGHPCPDARSAHASVRLASWFRGRRHDERVVFVLSGGTSSLLACPCEGLTFADLANTTEALLGSGLAIDDINMVRGQLTRSSGGRLLRGCEAQIEVLVLCDVVSGDFAAVGSGPFVPLRGTCEQARVLLEGVPAVPEAVRTWLRDPPAAVRPPSPGDAVWTRVRHRVLATPATLIAAAVEAASLASDFGEVVQLPPSTDDVSLLPDRLQMAAEGLGLNGIVVGGGEPSVTLPASPGCGGRNQHLALLMAKAIAGQSRQFLSLGSDGSDGPTAAAGALVNGRSWARLCAIGDPDAAIADANAYPLLEAAELLVVTGPTGTNLCDLHLLAVNAER